MAIKVLVESQFVGPDDMAEPTTVPGAKLSGRWNHFSVAKEKGWFSQNSAQKDRESDGGGVVGGLVVENKDWQHGRVTPKPGCIKSIGHLLAEFNIHCK